MHNYVLEKTQGKDVKQTAMVWGVIDVINVFLGLVDGAFGALPQGSFA